MAVMTQRVTLGAMVFSLARRRPWKVARETLTLDNLAKARPIEADTMRRSCTEIPCADRATEKRLLTAGLGTSAGRHVRRDEVPDTDLPGTTFPNVRCDHRIEAAMTISHVIAEA